MKQFSKYLNDKKKKGEKNLLNGQNRRTGKGVWSEGGEIQTYFYF